MTEHRKGILYCIGVGPGEPELMTLKAARMIKECQVAAIPHVDRAQCVAYQIAVQAVPELEEKELLCLDMPMTCWPAAMRPRLADCWSSWSREGMWHC